MSNFHSLYEPQTDEWYLTITLCDNSFDITFYELGKCYFCWKQQEYAYTSVETKDEQGEIKHELTTTWEMSVRDQLEMISEGDFSLLPTCFSEYPYADQLIYAAGEAVYGLSQHRI